MAVVGPTFVNDMTAAESLRLLKDVTAGLAIVNGNSYRARIKLPAACVSVSVRLKMTVSGGSPTVQIKPQTADIRAMDLTVSDVTTGMTAATVITTATEMLHTYTALGDVVVDVVVDAVPASAAGTMTYCDVFVKVV